MAVLALLLVASGCGSSPVPAPGPNVGTALDGAIPKAILDLPLRDSAGRVRHLSDFAGKVLVISDSMTLCQETCPLDTASVVHTARRVAAAGDSSRVEFLTITVDPQRDTVPQLRAYRRLYAGPSNWLTLTGRPQVVDELWKYFGVYRKKVPADQPPPHNWRTGKVLTYDVQHSDEVFFLDGRQRERFILEGAPVVPDKAQIPKRVYRFLSKDGRKNVAHPADTAWTEAQAVDVVSWLLDRRIA